MLLLIRNKNETPRYTQVLPFLLPFNMRIIYSLQVTDTKTDYITLFGKEKK